MTGLNNAEGCTLTRRQTKSVLWRLSLPRHLYMWFVSAVIHAVRATCFEESHQSVNLKKKKKIGRYLLLFKTNQREPGRGKGRGRFKVERKSAPLRDGEGGLEGGLRHSPHCGASFYKVHHITSASHFHRYIIICLPPKACLLWLRILSQTRLILTRSVREETEWQ